MVLRTHRSLHALVGPWVLALPLVLVTPVTSASEPGRGGDANGARAGDGQSTASGRAAKPLPEGALLRIGSSRLVNPEPVGCLAISRDGARAVTCARTSAPIVWDLAQGRRVTRLENVPNPKYVRAAAFDAEGKTVSLVSLRREVITCDARTGKRIRHRTISHSGARSWRSADFALDHPDGLHVVVSGAGDGPEVFDVATGKRRFVAGRQRWVTEVDQQGNARRGSDVTAVYSVISDDGQRICACYNRGPMRLFDLPGRKGKEIENAMHFGYLAISGDGSRCARITRAGNVRVWDCNSRKEIFFWSGDGGRALPAVELSRDGKYLAIYGGGTDVRVWEVSGKRVVYSSPTRWSQTPVLAFGPRGRKLYMIRHDRVLLEVDLEARPDARDGRRGLPGHDGPIKSLSVGPEGRRVAAVGLDGRCIVWDATTGKALRAFGSDDGWVAAGFSPDGDRLLLAGMKTVRLLEYPTGRTVGEMKWDTYGDRGVGLSLLQRRSALDLSLRCQVAFSRDGRRATALWPLGQSVTLDARTGEQVAHGQWRRQLAYATKNFLLPGARAIATGALSGRAHNVTLWSVAGREYIGELPASLGAKGVLAVSPDGAVVAAAGDERVRLIEVASMRAFGEFDLGGRDVTAMAFSPNPRLLAVGNADGSIHVLDLADGKPASVLRGHQGAIASLAFCPDGRLVSGGYDTTLVIWRAPAVGTDSRRLTDEQFARLWKDLLSADARKANRSLWQLASGASSSVVRRIAERVPPVRPPEARLVHALLAQLDSDSYAERVEAQRRLIRLGRPVEPYARRALSRSRSPEQRMRLELVLDEFRDPFRRGRQGIRDGRVTRLLEAIGTDEAADCLQALAAGAEGAALTTAAARALARMAARPRPEAPDAARCDTRPAEATDERPPDQAPRPAPDE
jgi:WD40 repeat protein